MVANLQHHFSWLSCGKLRAHSSVKKMPCLHVQHNKTGFERTYQCSVKRGNMVSWLVCAGRTCKLNDLTTPNFVLNILELKLYSKNILRWKCGSVYKINQPCPLVAIKFVSAIFAEGHSEDWFQRRKCLASYKGIYGNRPHTLVALFYCGSNLF